MNTTYYVRRSKNGRATRNLDKLITIMSTPRKIDALTTAAECAIVNSGCHYYVYRGDTKIAKFYVKKES